MAAFSDTELEQLYGDLSPVSLSPVASAPVEGDTVVPWKRTKQVVNIIPKGVNSLLEGLQGVAGMIDPIAAPKEAHVLDNTLPSFDVGPDKGIGDVLLNRVAPEIAGWTIPYLGISKAAKAAGAVGLGGRILSEGLAQGGANFIMGTKDIEHVDQPFTSGGVGLASGILQTALPRWQRALPLAAVSAVEGIAHDNWAGAAGNFAFNMLGGSLKDANALKSVTEPILQPNKFDAVNEAAGLIRPPVESRAQPGQFSFMDQVPIREPATPEMTGDLFNQAPDLKLGGHTLPEQLNLRDMTPSNLQLDHFPVEPPSRPLSTLDDVSTAGLRLENEPAANTQEEFPLIKLQSEGITDPNAPKFNLHEPVASTEGGQLTSELADWRTHRVAHDLHLAIEDAKPPTEAPPPFDPNPVGPKPAEPAPPETPSASKPAPPDNLGGVEPITPKLSELSAKERTALRLEKGKMDAAHRKGEPFVKRAKDFETTGEYEVTMPNGEKQGMHRDPENGWWYRVQKEGEKQTHFTDRVLGFTKKEATDALMNKYGKEVPKVTEPNTALRKESAKVLPSANPLPQQTLPLVMSPTGELSTPAPRQAGPHIISTVLDEGDGQYLSGDKWNTPHQKGPDNIFTQNIEMASGTGKSAFLLQDERGIIRVTQDRAEAARIAEMAGQRAPDKTGALQSEDLIDPAVKPEPKTVEQHRVAESVDDATQLAAAKKVEARIAELTQDLKFAREEGDEISARGITAAIGKMRRANAGTAGMATPQTLGILAIGGLAGLVTYQQTKGDMGATLAAAAIVMGLGIGGAKAFSHLKGIVGPEVKIPKVVLPAEKIAEKFNDLAIRTIKTPAGLAVGGRGGLINNALLGAEDFFGLNRLAFYKDIKVKSGGFVDDILNQQAAALKAVKDVNPSAPFGDATARYLRGQLNDPVQVQSLLNSGGIISSEGGAWSKLSKTEQAKYPEKWMQLDDQTNTNTKGDEVTIWHVTNSVKQQLVQGERDALMRLASTPDDTRFAKYAFATRENFDVLMQTIHAAAGPKEARRLIGTMGQYVTRSHALITDPHFYPEEPVIQQAMDNLASYKTDSFLSSVESGRYAPPTGTAGTNVTIGGKIYNVSHEAAILYDNLYTPESLRAVVTQQIKEIKSYNKARATGLFSSDESQLQGGLFTGRKELDMVRQVLLGTHTAPQEMIRETFNKLLPAAHSAHTMLGLTQAKEASGLSGRFASELEYNQEVRALKDQLSLAPDLRAQRAIQNQLTELANYMPISHDNPAMGLFQGSYVSRHVYSQLDQIMNPFGVLEGAMGKGLQTFNNIFKETHLVWNPVTQARNAVQVPMMLVIGRAAHDTRALQTAFDVVFKDQTSDIARWAVQNGSMSGNPVKGEFNFNMRQLIDGSADNQIWGLFAKTRQFAHNVYSKPDDFVRTATFIAAARREAARLGVPEDVMHLNQDVSDAAREFMNRRAMDYSNVPKWVKAGRQIPLVSPFLTYAHEIVRVTKNMAIDAAKGDLVSAAGLAGLATFPFLAQKYAEDALSPADRDAWSKGQAAAQDYSRPRFKMPMSRNADGTFNYYDITPIMPFGDYLMMGRAISQGDVGSIAAVNPIAGIEKSPLLSLAAAQITGQDIHTRREFRDGWDRAKNVLQEISPPWTPGIGADAPRDFPEALGGKLGQVNVKTGRTYTIKGALLRNVLGLDETQVNPNMAVATRVKIAQHDIANERQYLNDTLRSQGISPEAKQRATNRYIAAVKSIADDLHSISQPQ